MFGLRQTGLILIVYVGNTLSIMCPLRFVEHNQMLRRCRRPAEVVLNVLLDVLNKGSPTAAALAKRVLQNLHKWTVSRKVDRWRGRFPRRA